MTRGDVGWVALCCLALGSGACSSRPAAETKPPEPPAEAQAPVAAAPEPKPSEAPAEPPKEPSAMAATLECKLSVAPSVPVGKPVELSFQLTNRSAAPLYVLSWRTPLENVGGMDFTITRDGAEVEYQGPMKKRASPQADQYVTVAPGATVEGKLDLASAYAMSQPGRYHIVFPGPLMDVADKQSDVPRSFDAMHARQVACNPVDTTLTKP